MNSTSTSALTGSGSATVHAAPCYTGGASKLSGTATVVPTPATSTATDPFAAASPPAASGTRTALIVSGTTHTTAQPGIYTSITTSGSGALTLAPGDYVIAGGALSATGSATITGSHVSIYLTCATYPSPCPSGAARAAVTLSSTGKLTLTGAADTSGITVFADRANTAPMTVSGSATATFTGSVYAPAATMTVSGTTTTVAVTGTLAVNQLAISGSAHLTDTAPTKQLPSAGYTYDGANRLTRSVIGGVTTSYTYDGAGLRASSTVGPTIAHFAWQEAGSALPLLLTDGATSYLYDDTGAPLEQVDANGTPTFYQHDQYGSTRVLTNAGGVTVATYSYGPYGQVTAHTGTVSTALLFDGQYQDASGLYYLRARYYDPATAQFLTRDPLTAATASPYGYADGDPANAADPSGMCWQAVTLSCPQDGSVGPWVGNGTSIIPNRPP